MKIAQMRQEAQMSQRSFADYFEIPIRTLQQWEQGKSSPPDYVISMIEKLRPSSCDSKQKPNRYALPERTHWKVCIDKPFKNCDRIYPIQQRKVRELLDDISQNKSVQRVTVFGSSVTQKCHQGSDVDVYVEMLDDCNPVSRMHDFAFDLWTNYSVDQRLKEEIERKGVTVYDG